MSNYSTCLLRYSSQVQRQRPQMLRGISSRTYATYKYFPNHSGSLFNINDQKTRKKLIYGFLGIAGFYLYNLNEAPISHRRRFLWIPDSFETFVGNMTYNSVMLQYQNQLLPHNHPVYAEVTDVVDRLIKSSEKLINTGDNNIEDGSFLRDKRTKEINWQVEVVNDPRAPPNAFVIPGGKIFVFSSILPICHNKDGIATVLGHEISHQLARHTAEQHSSNPFLTIGLLILSSTIQIPAKYMDWALNLVTLKMSRTMESEADYIGLILMSDACFNPEEAPKFWRRMQKATKQVSGAISLPEYASTHPNSERREHDMVSWLPEARTRKAASGCDDAHAFFSVPW